MLPKRTSFISVNFLIVIDVCFVLTQIQQSTQHKNMILLMSYTPYTLKRFMELIYSQDNAARNHVRVCVFPECWNFHVRLKNYILFQVHPRE
jgi:predicted amidohydrolase